MVPTRKPEERKGAKNVYKIYFNYCKRHLIGQSKCCSQISRWEFTRFARFTPAWVSNAIWVHLYLMSEVLGRLLNLPCRVYEWKKKNEFHFNPCNCDNKLPFIDSIKKSLHMVCNKKGKMNVFFWLVDWLIEKVTAPVMASRDDLILLVILYGGFKV